MRVAIQQAQEFDADSLNLSKGHRETMDTCIKISSMVWVGQIEGEIACVWGIVPKSLLSDQAYLWMHHTDVVHDHQFLFVRHSQMALAEVLKEVNEVVGHVNEKAWRSIRWLKWLGASFGEVEGKKLSFVIRKK